MLVEKDYPNILFATDGSIYEFNKKRCMVIGGAYSVDKYYRLQNGLKWFADEQPDETTKEYVRHVLDFNNKDIDVFLTHTCPYKYIPTEAFLQGVDQSTVDNSTERWLDSIEESTQYKRWYCGHYHINKAVDKIVFLFTDTIPFSAFD